MSFKKGDIVLVKFPFTDFSNYKKRPVLIVKDENELGDIVCFQITSNKYQSKILKIEDKFLSNKLKIDSFVKYDKCFTINSSVIDKKLSTLNQNFLEKLKEYFCNELF